MAISTRSLRREEVRDLAAVPGVCTYHCPSCIHCVLAASCVRNALTHKQTSTYIICNSPIMASFAIQAVTQVMTRISIYRLDERKAETGVDEITAKNHGPPVAHAEYIERFARRWEARAAGDAKDIDIEITDTETEVEALVYETIKQALEVEAHARRLLIDHLPNGSKGQVIMKADRNVQLRDVDKMRAMVHDGEDSKKLVKRFDVLGDADQVSLPLTEEQTLDEVNRYRESFAAFLAAASRLRKLEGAERFLMERRLQLDRQGEGRDKDREEQKRKEENEDTL